MTASSSSDRAHLPGSPPPSPAATTLPQPASAAVGGPPAGLTDTLVIAAAARQREPELPAATVQAALDAPLPATLARYDLILLLHGADGPAAARAVALAEAFSRHGHRVFRLLQPPSPSAPPATPAPNLLDIPSPPLPSPPDDGTHLLDALATLRHDHAIETAALYVATPDAAASALLARQRWGWRVVADETALPVQTDPAVSPTPDTARLPAGADVLLTPNSPDSADAIDRYHKADSAIRAAFPRATIAVVTYDNLAFTKLCLASILANTDYPNYEVVVIDNGSTDGTPAYLQALADLHPHVRVLLNRQNLGFAPANNQALTAATGDLLLLLNNDTIVPPGWLTRLAHHLEDRSLGLLGPATNRTCNEAQVEAPYQTYGEFLRFARERAATLDEQPVIPIRMPMMFCAAMRRDVYERVGPLDERYVVGMFEDEDYALRVKAAGYEVAWAPDAYVHHAYHASIGKLLPTGEYAALFAANRQRFEEKWNLTWQPHRPRPEPAAQDDRPILVGCDRPTNGFLTVIDGPLVVSGWTLAPSGVRTVETLVDDQPRGTITHGEPRPKVPPHADYPDLDATGFDGSIPTGDLANGLHTLVVRFTRHDGRQGALTIRFEVDANAVTSGRLLAFLDRPALVRPTPVKAEYLGVWGWALSSSGIAAVETFVDGAPRGKVSYGSLRPDVAATYPTFPGVEHSGFVGTLPVEDLAPGPHRLVVRITAADDKRTEIARDVEIAPRHLAIGEVPRLNAQYQEWLALHQPTDEDISEARVAAKSLSYQPTFDLIVPVSHSDAPGLRATIDAVRAQAYNAWRLFLAPTDPSVALRALLSDLAALDRRITLIAPPAGSGHAVAANLAVGQGTGEFVSLLDPSTLLSPLYLSEMARALNDHPDTDLAYADEDKIDDQASLHWDPFFKPDWSPDLLLSMDYIGPSALYRRTMVQKLGALRSGLNGAETYDLTLRLTERTDRVLHVPRILSSRRADPSAPAQALMATHSPPAESADRALTDALARRAIAGRVEPGLAPGRWRVRYDLSEQPEITVVVPTGGKLRFLQPCLDSLLTRTTYPNLRVLVVDNSDDNAVADLCGVLRSTHPNLRRVPLALKPFNFSAIINHAIPLVETPYLVLLNDDITVITPDGLETMLEHAQRPEVGVVGAKLLFPDDTIQHAGVVLGPYEMSTHPFRHFPASHPGYFEFPHLVRNYGAVTFACAMLRREIFDEVGLLDADHLPIAFNDVDMCLRIGERGYRVVYTPHAVLYHHESVTKTAIADGDEVGYMRGRWSHVIKHDPFYNPNLTRKGEDFSLNME